MSNRMIRKREYWAIEVETTSPLCVSGGQNEETDSDVMVNGHGDPFIPGTSITGAMRDFLGLEKYEPGILGYGHDNQGQMSAVFVSDLYFDMDTVVISIRDRVKLNEDRTVNNKFDMEAIETGARGTLFINYLVRDGEDSETFSTDVNKVLQGIQNGLIRFGSVKNRGFGQMKLNLIRRKTFDFGKDGFDLNEWIEFKKNAHNSDMYPEGKSFDNWLSSVRDSENKKYIRITVPLRLTGGISIRVYSTTPREADYEHITCNGEPVIPGTSWAGAIRADAREILGEICEKESEAEQIVDQWFGFVSEKNKEAVQSRVVIGESVIRDSRKLTMTRTRINRFDGSVINSALYQESAFYGGRTELQILIRRGIDSFSDNRALLDLLTLVIQDIQNGYVPVGGEVAIGRGIFAADGAVCYEVNQPDVAGADLYARIREESDDEAE